MNKENFNSIKVQLKRDRDPRFKSKKAFQFHKGTIKTVPRIEETTFYPISIP